MKLEKILDRLSSIEKNSFIKIIDNIISRNKEKAKAIEKILTPANTGLKSADNENISKIFELTADDFLSHIFLEFQEVSSQLDILIDIIIRDGNCIMKQDWFSRLYDAEIKSLKNKIKNLGTELENDKSELSDSRKRDYKIYQACLHTAFNNDISNNREPKITSDELSIILTLSKELGLSQEEIKLINYSILPIKKTEILDVITNLKNIGVVFYSKKENTIFIADEMVRILLREPIINSIAKRHNIDKKLNYSEKVEEIIKAGVPFSELL